MNILWGPHQCPYSEPQTFPTSQETLQDLQVGLAQASVESLLCFGSQGTETLCAPSKVISLLPSVLWSSCTQAPLAWKAKCFLLIADPRLRSLMWGLELSLLWKKL